MPIELEICQTAASYQSVEFDAQQTFGAMRLEVAQFHGDVRTLCDEEEIEPPANPPLTSMTGQEYLNTFPTVGGGA